jgi:hypothetical protein
VDLFVADLPAGAAEPDHGLRQPPDGGIIATTRAARRLATPILDARQLRGGEGGQRGRGNLKTIDLARKRQRSPPPTRTSGTRPARTPPDRDGGLHPTVLGDLVMFEAPG